MQDSAPVAIVTGASRGIGKGCAIALAEAGYDLVVAARTLEPGEPQEMSETVQDSDVRPVPGTSLAETVAEIEALGRRALAVRVDLLEQGDMDALVERTLDEFGRIDVLVNNARWVGRGYKDPFLITPHEVFEALAARERARAALPAREGRPRDDRAGRRGRRAHHLAQRHRRVLEAADERLDGAAGALLRGQQGGLQPHRARPRQGDRRAQRGDREPRARRRRRGAQGGPARRRVRPREPRLGARGRAQLRLHRKLAHPMYYSGLTVFAPEFAIERGLVEPDEIAAGRTDRWGQPGRVMATYSGLVETI